MEAEEAAMLSLMSPLTGYVVLDMACGTGRYGLLATARGAARVVSIDNSAAMLNANQSSLRALATTESLPLSSASIDIILCGLALGHLPHLESSLLEISRVLKPGGWTLISDFHPFIFMKGQKRTFTAPDGAVYAVEHYVHLYSDYFRAATAADLRLYDVAEVGLPRSSKKGFADDRIPPVVIAYRFHKP
jgi:malonyl-CoA O-methyltransferase